MQVGIFCDSFLPENKAVAVRMFHVATAFHEMGSQTSVHCSTRGVSSTTFSIKPNFFKAPDNTSGTVSRLLSEILLGLELFLKVLFCKYSLVVISSPPFFTSCMVATAAIWKKIPIVFDVRDEYPEVYFSAGLVSSKGLLGKALLWVESWIYRNALLTATVTEGIVERIGQKQPKAKIELLRNGFDETLFIPSKSKEEIFTVVFHGNIGKFQRPDLILELAYLAQKKSLPIQFRVIGWGNNDEVLKQDTPSNLIFQGMVDYDLISTLIGRAHIGISFRSTDTISVNSFPVKLYEYIGVGVPMLVVPKSEAGDLITKRMFGYQFSGDNAGEILNKIVELMENPWLMQQLTRNVLNARSEFSRQVICRNFVEKLQNDLAYYE
ncbi:MAG: glycosyltransferase family 4 protein [Cyclobacteriaceae bacterium]